MRVYSTLAIAAILGFWGFLGSAGLAQAEPLNLKQVAADAKWAAHVDFDALRAASVAKKAHEQFKEKHPEAEQHLAMFQSVWKFNPCTDLHGVTIYGQQLKKETGVAIVCVKVDQATLLEKAKLAPEHRVSTYGKHELHTWTHAKGSKHQRSMTGTFYAPDVLVFGGSTDEVMAALDVLDGTKPNLAAKEPSLAGEIPPGAVVVAGVGGLSEADLPCKSPVVKQIDLLVLAAGEDKGKVFFGAKATAKETETAQQLKTVVEGARAFAVMAHGDDADVMKVINAVKVSVNDKTVAVECRVPADDVWTCIQKVAKKIERDGLPPHFGPLGHHPPKND